MWSFWRANSAWMIDQIKDSPKVVHGKRQIEAEADNYASESEQKEKKEKRGKEIRGFFFMSTCYCFGKYKMIYSMKMTIYMCTIKVSV